MKKNKFFVWGMLAAALTFGVISAGCDTGTSSGGGDDDDTPVEIGTLAELNAISANAKSLGRNYKLTADITGVTTPVGIVSGADFAGFTGDFDGNGHSIAVNITSGLTVSTGPLAGIYGGLFAGIDADGSVHDLTVDGRVNITTSGNLRVVAGGIAAGMFTGASIKNVSSSVVVNVTSSGNGDVVAGGIAGGVMAATVSNSHATGNVSAASTSTSGDINADAGGVVGAVMSGDLSGVYATGNVSASAGGKNAQAGGIVGAADESSQVTNVYATGNVSATGTATRADAGGIAGNSGGGAIRWAYATGSVSVTANGTRAQAGGIVGNIDPASVSNTVALSASVGITGSASQQDAHRVIGRVGSERGTSMAKNYGNAALTPTESSYNQDKGADKKDGEDITVTGGPPPAAYTAPGETWWRDTGFSGADWTTVWQWDGTKGLPVLR
ncbi:MAG: hypothetical protein LBP29_06775 [Treponema sp.]|jgi:hypothetical protein|nr:hypothetical protein [Treponema sp.]